MSSYLVLLDSDGINCWDRWISSYLQSEDQKVGHSQMIQYAEPDLGVREGVKGMLCDGLIIALEDQRNQKETGIEELISQVEPDLNLTIRRDKYDTRTGGERCPDESLPNNHEQFKITVLETYEDPEEAEKRLPVVAKEYDDRARAFVDEQVKTVLDNAHRFIASLYRQLRIR
jgi:hypothetical protein